VWNRLERSSATYRTIAETDPALWRRGTASPSLPVPAGMHWDEWIGPSRTAIFQRGHPRRHGCTTSGMAPSAT